LSSTLCSGPSGDRVQLRQQVRELLHEEAIAVEQARVVAVVVAAAGTQVRGRPGQRIAVHHRVPVVHGHRVQGRVERRNAEARVLLIAVLEAADRREVTGHRVCEHAVLQRGELVHAVAHVVAGSGHAVRRAAHRGRGQVELELADARGVLFESGTVFAAEARAQLDEARAHGVEHALVARA
jgi:hypothetical protein